MKIETKNKLNHFKRIETGECFGNVLYLGIYDSPNNYTEVTEQEYQEWLKAEEENRNKLAN